jgi:hypothetical protein
LRERSTFCRLSACVMLSEDAARSSTRSSRAVCRRATRAAPWPV